MRLASEHDFTGVLETHGTKDVEDTIRLPAEFDAFWSHGTSQQAGVGLIIRSGFLLKFNTVQQDDWTHVIPGRVARLSLRGPKGCLDIFVAYFPTGSQGAQERLGAIDKNAGCVQFREKALTVLVGDWNFDMDDKDRFCKRTGAWTGQQDRNNKEC